MREDMFFISDWEFWLNEKNLEEELKIVIQNYINNQNKGMT
jgi:hypothetical protein